MKYLERRFEEFEFRLNNRHNPSLFRDTLLRTLASSNLDYNNLTADKTAQKEKL